MATPRFDWDAGNTNHITPRLVTPEEAESVFADPYVAWVGISVIAGEWRFEFIGQAHSGRIITVVITPRGDRLRVVTAYRARPRFIREYLSGR